MIEIRIEPLRLALVGCLIALIGAAPTAEAGQGGSFDRARSGVPELAGRTTISGTESAMTEVSLPTAALIRIQTPEEAGKSIPGMSITGDGRVAGFYLTEPDVTNLSRVSLLGVQMRFCAESGCRRSDRPHRFVISSDNAATTGGEHNHSRWATLPPGRYLLHLITDGAPVRVSLRLKGLPGVTTIGSLSRVGSGTSLPAVENSTTAPAEKAFWYGDGVNFSGSAGMFVGALRMDVEDWSYLRWGACIGQGEPITPPAIAYSPLCPQGLAVGVSRTELVPTDRGFVYPFFAFVNEAGPWHFGQYFAGVFGRADFDSLGFHMDLDPSAAR